MPHTREMFPKSMPIMANTMEMEEMKTFGGAHGRDAWLIDTATCS